MGAGAWEIVGSNRVLVGILHTEQTTVAWSFGLRNLIVPGREELRTFCPFLPVAGMPFDHARNTICRVALDVGASHCFKSGHLVETSLGAKRIEEVQMGDLVRTHLGRFREVTQVMRRKLPCNAPLCWVRTKYSLFKCTPEHPFFTSRDGGAGEFILAGNLRAGDALLYPDKFKEDWLDFDIRYNTLGVNGDGKKGSVRNGQQLGKIPVTEDVARFLGLYLAEGCVTDCGINFTFNNNESEYIDFIIKTCDVLFGRQPSVISRWATNVSLSIRSLGKLFAVWFKKGARNKRVPPFVYNWSLRNRLAFLRGYLDGDGSLSGEMGREDRADQVVGVRHKTPVWSYCTASNRLVMGIKRLAASCGLVTKTCRVAASVAVMVDGKEIHSSGGTQGWFSKKSGEKVEDLLDSVRDGDYLRVPVVSVHDKNHSIPKSEIGKYVYNLEVEEDHSYIVDSSAVHNCFMLDSDVIPPRDAILRLLAHRKPIIGGVYFRRSPPAGVPVAQKYGTWVDLKQHPLNSVIEVDLIGAGCLLISRELLEKLPPQRPEAGKTAFDWRVDCTGILPQHECLSEDFTFCTAAKKIGVATLLDTSIRCRHCGASEAYDGGLKPLETVPLS